jgi:hypothetical protein
MKRLFVSLTLAVLLLAGCGGGSQSAAEALAETSQNLGQIKSGDLGLKLMFSAKGGERAGFTLEGPFALHQGQLPEAQLDYTQVAGDRTTTQTFIMAGDKSYVSIRGTTYELPAETSGQIRGTLGNSGGLGAIDLSSWVQEPRLEDGDEVDGVGTDRITGHLNVANVVSGLVAIASQFGGTTPLSPLSGASAEQVQQAVDSATIDVYTGKDDRLLRKLDISMTFSPSADEVKDLVGAAVDFTLSISGPNEEVRIETPTNAQPYSAS